MNKPRWINRDDCIVLHEMTVLRYGGVGGVRDPAVLDAVVNQAKERFALGTGELVELSACYAVGIAVNRPFSLHFHERLQRSRRLVLIFVCFAPFFDGRCASSAQLRQIWTRTSFTIYCCFSGNSSIVDLHLIRAFSRVCSGFVRPYPAFVRLPPNEGRIKSSQGKSNPGAGLHLV